MSSDNYVAKASEGTYLVHLGELHDWQMSDHEHNVKCDTFERAKAYALDGLRAVIGRLTHICEQTQVAGTYGDLDLGWCRPISERIDGVGKKHNPDDGEIVLDKHLDDAHTEAASGLKMQSASGDAIRETSEAYLVHLDYLVHSEMDEHDVRCDTFEAAKTYALEGVQTLIGRLNDMCEQLKAAEKFDDLDPSWWEPIIMERIDGSITEKTVWDGERIFDVSIMCG
jgi:hypothetical protein